MKIDKDKVKKAGKYAGAGVVGAGVAAGGMAASDNADNPQQQIQNLQETVDELNETVEAQEGTIEDREATIDDLEAEVDNLDDRPTQQEYTQLQNQLADAFTQEEVNEMLEREDLIEYLPVLADEDVEVLGLAAEYDVDSDEDNLDDNVDAVPGDFDDDEFEGEEYDEVRADYEHDDGHEYYAVAREFEDSEDADVYEEGLRDAVEDEEYDESLTKDAAVVRDGNTVVFLYGEAEEDDYNSYDFEAVTGQY